MNVVISCNITYVRFLCRVPDYQTKQPSVDVFNAMEKDDCSRFYCKNYDHFREVNKYDVREWRN